MKIAVIDGQGAGIGKAVIKKLRKEFNNKIYITALGTNPLAASNMLKAGADYSIAGEDCICSFCENNHIDSIIGPIGIICSGALNGEITTRISTAIFDIDCVKYIIPLQKHGIYIPGTRDLQIKDIIEEIVTEIKIMCI